MVNRFYGYQYDTNPRKLSPENTQIRNRYSRNGEDKTENKEKVNSSTRKRNTYFQEDDDDAYLFERKQKNQPKREADNSINNDDKKEKLNFKNEVIKKVNSAKKNKNNIKPKLKIVTMLIVGFSVLFAISYQNSLINESFNKKEQYKKEAEALSKTNQQLAVNIENSLNLNNVEQAAKEKLGMQKLSNNQKIYVNLPKVDYVAPATEQIIIEEDTGFINKIINGFSKAIK